MISRDPYGPRFQNLREPGSTSSAQVVVPLVIDLLQPSSVVDVGCGSGSWLAEFKRLGVSEILGIDGPGAAATSDLGRDEFLVHDLLSPLKLERRFDLAVCVEVAEHLPERSGAALVAELVRMAPAILFSAAIPHQGGTGHINEQWPEYWAGHFSKHGYVPVDCLRRHLWAHSDVEFWYAQNLLLFAPPDVIAVNEGMARAASFTRPEALAQVHPALYLAKVRHPELTLRSILSSLPTLVGRAGKSGARRLSSRLHPRSAPSSADVAR